MGKRNTIGRQAVHRSAAEGRALVEQWRRSGLSVSEFCRQQSVGVHVLRYWLTREGRPGAAAATTDAFYIVSAPKEEESAPLAKPSVREGSRAVIVVLPTATSEQLVRTLRGLLEEVRA